ncbi:tRNA threonylcarbamoyladenosine biosynthesis protein TsaE [Stieleria maiorica]|uniref:tRNA threonylcarbamoyladenosine biosynthesis protein TsaE n=1 Tax=Stieleria maiorica TaxID=2795974 RepID=A0A5B9MN06_9BACT|nr:tRNA (adenosine(37)-N6)-threonylcarbamoyltransferase complex ATPase subunit type 1 TsaE [Stieleria maiorica]QEG02693.1 tRNA threonylcarbamoyladenosine biosynthesis protein TsaE [Stieleria maiorica]
MPSLTFNDVDLDRLRKLAGELVRLMPARLVIGLVGTLGAGKTTFTQSLAAAMGVDPEDVTSPTFTLLCSYDATIHTGPIRLHHLDAYRLVDEDEFLELGVEELFDADNTWVLIEWADRVESVLPPETLWIHIDIPASDDPIAPQRQITLTTQNDALAGPLAALADAMPSK